MTTRTPEQTRLLADSQVTWVLLRARLSFVSEQADTVRLWNIDIDLGLGEPAIEVPLTLYVTDQFFVGVVGLEPLVAEGEAPALLTELMYSVCEKVPCVRVMRYRAERDLWQLQTEFPVDPTANPPLTPATVEVAIKSLMSGATVVAREFGQRVKIVRPVAVPRVTVHSEYPSEDAAPPEAPRP